MSDRYKVVVPDLSHFYSSVKAKVVPRSVPAKVAAAALNRTDHRIEAEVRVDTLKYVNFDSCSIMNLIQTLKSANKLLEMVMNKSIDRVVMGPKVYHSLLRGMCEIPYPVSIDVQSAFGYRGERFMAGFLVQMIPWYDSDDILIVPLAENRRPNEITPYDLEEKQRQIDLLKEENERLRQAVLRGIFERTGVKESPERSPSSVFLVTSGEGSDDDPWTLHAICTSLELARLFQEKNKEPFECAYIETKIEEWTVEG